LIPMSAPSFYYCFASRNGKKEKKGLRREPESAGFWVSFVVLSCSGSFLNLVGFECLVRRDPPIHCGRPA
jgi:hypothetical protein